MKHPVLALAGTIYHKTENGTNRKHPTGSTPTGTAGCLANRFDSRYKTQPSTACAFERGVAITINALKTFRRHSQARLEQAMAQVRPTAVATPAKSAAAWRTETHGCTARSARRKPTSASRYPTLRELSYQSRTENRITTTQPLLRGLQDLVSFGELLLEVPPEQEASQGRGMGITSDATLLLQSAWRPPRRRSGRTREDCSKRRSLT